MTLALTRALADRLGDAPGRVYASTLLPIAAGYLIAHYLTLVIQGVVWLPALLVDPLMSLAPELGWIPVSAVWYLSVAAIVGGHIAGVVLAHRLALRDAPRRATVAGLPMLALMISYTVLSLWIIAQPIVIEPAGVAPGRSCARLANMTEVSIAIAVAAGLLSFVSPCVLALLPVYLAFLGDAAVADDSGTVAATRVGRPAAGAPLRDWLQRLVHRAGDGDRPARRAALSNPGGAPGGRRCSRSCSAC